ncbi:hypothetical protein LZ32DRAFT_455472 [Colletotrichum eremochloae]|nr:hypothetical protein LZ32DRAFT_455472 [Colletotrichum eremochloae]
MLRRQQLLVLRRKICFRSLRGPVALAVLQQLGLLPAGCDKLGAQIRLHCHGNPDGPLVHLFAPGKRPSFASCLNEVPSEPVICSKCLPPKSLVRVEPICLRGDGTSAVFMLQLQLQHISIHAIMLGLSV